MQHVLLIVIISIIISFIYYNYAAVFTACRSGTYGERCGEECRCPAGQPCNHVTGECACPSGYAGLACELRTYRLLLLLH